MKREQRAQRPAPRRTRRTAGRHVRRLMAYGICAMMLLSIASPALAAQAQQTPRLVSKKSATPKIRKSLTRNGKIPRARALAQQGNLQVETNPQISVGMPVTPAHFNGDARRLPQIPIPQREEIERPRPGPRPETKQTLPEAVEPQAPAGPGQIVPAAPAPTPLLSFKGLTHDANGNGWPPDTNGDVGDLHYIQ
ncbi:MAG: hypothetical protein ICV60_24375, partial [Pyrinomonadaceae bacterium]|nr:hypothetical protein [Pyrinomonadaceae bacterium]